jgi:hypothetical protein
MLSPEHALMTGDLRGFSNVRLNELERKDLARRHLDATETWLRRVIDVELTLSYGSDYLAEASTCPEISKKMRERINGRYTSNPSRFPRLIDAADLGDAIKIVLNDALYKDVFRDALHEAFPDGNAEARTFLNRLDAIRNKLAHGGTCSDRDLERSICYSNDVTDSIKAHFRMKNMEREFNVPTFIRVFDNRGNDFHFSPKPHFQFVDVRATGKGDLYVGETLSIEFEVDPTFKDFTIRWMTFSGDYDQSLPCTIKLAAKHVGVEFDVRLTVRSSLDWHRFNGGVDDMVDLRYRVLPPP